VSGGTSDALSGVGTTANVHAALAFFGGRLFTDIGFVYLKATHGAYGHAVQQAQFTSASTQTGQLNLQAIRAI